MTEALKCENVEELLKALKRPATSFEIVMAMADVKNKNSVHSEIRSLLANGSVRKISIPIKGYDGELTLYLRLRR